MGIRHAKIEINGELYSELLPTTDEGGRPIIVAVRPDGSTRILGDEPVPGGRTEPCPECGGEGSEVFRPVIRQLRMMQCDEGHEWRPGWSIKFRPPPPESGSLPEE